MSPFHATLGVDTRAALHTAITDTTGLVIKHFPKLQEKFRENNVSVSVCVSPLYSVERDSD
jgi:hypothetical protein